LVTIPCPFRALAALLALLVSCGATSFAGGLRETSDYADIVAAVDAAARQYGPGEVLLVSDLDNTLLSMDQDLGSDQWFEWQSFLLNADPKSCYLVARDFDGLLRVQGILFAALHAHPTQPDLPRLIARVQDAGIATMVLTARGQDFRTATERELARNAYDFSKTAPKLREQSDDNRTAATLVFPPYRKDALPQAGISDEERVRWKLPDEPRPISYGNGVLMVAGQHKGAMLLAFLQHAAKSYKAVIFTDQDRQVRRVYEALSDHGQDVTSIEYQREDARVKAFNYQCKDPVNCQWRQFERALSAPCDCRRR
jgi:hypothetical protein